MNIKINNIQKKHDTIPMSKMKPLDVGIITDINSRFHNTAVMRTASKMNFEVMSLSNPDENNCWEKIGFDDNLNDIQVRILDKTEYEIIINIFQ